MSRGRYFVNILTFKLNSYSFQAIRTLNCQNDVNSQPTLIINSNDHMVF